MRPASTSGSTRACARSWPRSAQLILRANTTRHAITAAIATTRTRELRTLREIGARHRAGPARGALGDRGEILVANASGEVIPVVAHRGAAIELALAHSRDRIELDDVREPIGERGDVG